jgi:hypothetical protein
MKLLMENWRGYLNENNPIDKAAGKGLGIHLVMKKDRGIVVVYDAKKILDQIEFWKKNDPSKLADPTSIIEILDGYQKIEVVAGVRFAKPTWDKGECNNALEITNSASKKNSKLGPTAYEAALYYVDGLTSDRLIVRPSAAKVWSIYSKRADSENIEKEPFDDYDSDQKKTPNDTSDDCALHKDRDPLNYSYNIESKPSGLQELEDNHVKVLAAMAQLGVRQRTILNALEGGFNYLFMSRYNA